MHGLNNCLSVDPLEGVKIRVRVGSRIYDVYVSDETKLKYRLHLKRINEISNTTLDQIQADAYFMQFVDVVQPSKFKFSLFQSHKMSFFHVT